VSAFLRSLPWLQPALDLVRLAVFAAFVALVVSAARAGAAGDPVRARRRVDRLIAFVLAVSAAVGVSQVESWPFSNWALVHGLASPRGAAFELEGLDGAGRGWRVDFRALQPLPPEEFASWLSANEARLSGPAKHALARYLLERAEAARRRARAGGSIGANDRLLGPLSAPHHFHLDPALGWPGPESVPAEPFVGLRVWRLEWDVEQRYADPASSVTRRLVMEAVPARL
jgi:hypothetical protein